MWARLLEKSGGGGGDPCIPHPRVWYGVWQKHSMRFATFKLGNWNFLLVYSTIFAYILQVDHNSTSLKMLLINKLSVESLHELFNIICVFFNFPRMPFHIVVLKRVITANKWNSKAKIKN